jgi:hypothetical protein
VYWEFEIASPDCVGIAMTQEAMYICFGFKQKKAKFTVIARIPIKPEDEANRHYHAKEF